MNAPASEQRWTTLEVMADFQVLGFASGLAVVKRKSDGQKGSLRFGRDDNGHRYYHDWKEHVE